MRTRCIDLGLGFQGVGRRKLEGRFDGGQITSDCGLILAREVSEGLGLFDRLAACFRDHRDPRRVQHSVGEMLGQRILGLVAGYEDLNDHDTLRDDPLLPVPTGKAEEGESGSSSATLNRLEHGSAAKGGGHRYHRIEPVGERIADLFIELGLERFEQAPRRIILDADATDARIHGSQEGRFFHGYYRSYCYLPLYVFWDDFPLVAKLRRSNIDGCSGITDEIAGLVDAIRNKWPDVDIWVRGDSGIARDELMAWCEEHGVNYVLGLAKNGRLHAEIVPKLELTEVVCELTGAPARMFKELRYRTLDSWSRERRVVAKAEHLPGKANPRFVVTSLSAGDVDARTVYEDLYAARGDMENRIKEQQLDMFADRVSAATMSANQLRIWFSTFAYLLMAELHRIGLVGTNLAAAQAGTIRVRLLKIGAQVRWSVHRVYIAFSCAFPRQTVFRTALRNIEAAFL
ncbi:MAG: IS1380 family transposase [Alphaproteobacteria bacterium]|nr:IS1380 family transposase [Alphaproteobacteria bacterium]